MTKKKMHIDKETEKNKSEIDNLFDELEKLDEEEKLSNESNSSDLLDDLEQVEDNNTDPLNVSDVDSDLDELFEELEEDNEELEKESKSNKDTDLDDLFEDEDQEEELEIENEPKSSKDSDLEDLFDEENEEELEIENEPKSSKDSDLDDLFEDEDQEEELEIENEPKSSKDSDLDDLFDDEEELEIEKEPKSNKDSDIEDLFEEEELEIENEPKSSKDSNLDDLFDDEDLEIENEPKSSKDSDLDDLFDNEAEEESETSKEVEKNHIIVDKNVKDSKLEIKEKEKGKNSMGSLIDRFKSQTNKKSELKEDVLAADSSEDIEVQKLYGKKGNSSSGGVLKVSLISAAITLTLIAGASFLLKDYATNYLVKKNTQIVNASEDKITAKVNSLEDELLAFNDKVSKDVVNVDQAKELFKELNNSDSVVLQDLSSKFENQLNQIDLLKRNLESIRSENYGIEKNIENHNQLISDISKTIENQKEIMKKTVQIALDVIQQSRDLEKNIESNIYERVMRNVKEEMSLQQSKLYDFSVIEDKLTTALNQNNELIKEVVSIKKENQNLQSQINALKLTTSQNPQPVQNTVRENKVIDVLKSPSDTIEITKRNNEPKPIIPSDNFISYEIIAVLEDKFYIKHDGSDRFKIYKIGEILEGYGKILKIEDQQIFAEKGIVRKK